jgi:alpha-tubulin suppressor-like RCC1 family protein
MSARINLMACVVWALAACQGFDRDTYWDTLSPTTPGDDDVPVVPPTDAPPGDAGAPNVVDFGVGNHRRCALVDPGIVRCVGSNAMGGLGDGTTTDSATPVTVVGLMYDATRLGVGGEHACAVLRDARTWCWGDNRYGQLGDGTTASPSTRPVVVPNLLNVQRLWLGPASSCARLADNSVQCWGRNDRGQLGDGTTMNRTTPVTIPALQNAVQIGLGEEHGCAVMPDHTVQCWGTNRYGQLGDGTTTNRLVPGPVTLPPGLNIDDIAVGGFHTSARTTTQGVGCWGRNDRGQLGDRSRTDHAVPVTAYHETLNQPLFMIAEIAAGTNHTCARTGFHGSVLCWGAGDSNQLGNGETIDHLAGAHNPAFGEPEPGATRILAGGLNACAVAADEITRCWGSNAHGQLGTTVTTAGRTAVPITW